jgi:hypothetical protein
MATMFSARHFIAIAATLRETQASSDIVAAFAVRFVRDNPNFDYGRFVRAATATEGNAS